MNKQQEELERELLAKMRNVSVEEQEAAEVNKAAENAPKPESDGRATRRSARCRGGGTRRRRRITSPRERMMTTVKTSGSPPSVARRG